MTRTVAKRPRCAASRFAVPRWKGYQLRRDVLRRSSTVVTTQGQLHAKGKVLLGSGAQSLRVIRDRPGRGGALPGCEAQGGKLSFLGL